MYIYIYLHINKDIQASLFGIWQNTKHLLSEVADANLFGNIPRRCHGGHGAMPWRLQGPGDENNHDMTYIYIYISHST